MHPASAAAVSAIDLYRRHLSPRKGYACPHRLLHGGDSCSAAASRLYHDLPPLSATRATLARLWACRDAGEALAHERGRRRGQCCIVIPLPTCSTPRAR